MTKLSALEIGRYLLAVLFVVMFALTTEALGVVCDRFKIVTNLTGSILELSVDTDLPDNTDVMVGVSRYYFEKGNKEEQSVEYFSEKGKIGKWRSKQNISLDADMWKSELKEKQKELARIGLGFDVSSISDKITIQMIVPINQADPMFGKQNSNLTGKSVKASGLRIVKDEVKIRYPLRSPPVGKSSFKNVVRVNPFKLEIGRTYSLSRQTPFLPPNSSSDPFEAMKHLKQIPQGGAIKVLRVVKDKGNPSYEVVAFDTNGQEIGRGLVISNALVGQQLETHK